MSGASAVGSCWKALNDSVKTARERAPTANEIQNQLLVRLKRLSTGEPARCSATVQGWLTQERTRERRVEISIKKSAGAFDSWKNPSIALKNLHHLEDGAVLRFAVTVSERAPKGILAYTVALEGKVRGSEKRWYAQVHLTEAAEGDGLCSHALLHCHMSSAPEEAMADDPAPIESDPTEPGSRLKRRPFSPRVPLPWLYPWEALEWLLATVDPEMEPVGCRSAPRPAAT